MIIKLRENEKFIQVINKLIIKLKEMENSVNNDN